MIHDEVSIVGEQYHVTVKLNLDLLYKMSFLELINLLSSCVCTIMWLRGREILQMNLLCCALRAKIISGAAWLATLLLLFHQQESGAVASLVLVFISACLGLPSLSTLANRSRETVSVTDLKAKSWNQLAFLETLGLLHQTNCVSTTILDWLFTSCWLLMLLLLTQLY